MKRRSSERGAALLFALGVVMILGGGTTILWRQLHGNVTQHRIAWNQEQAFQWAEAGLDTALDGLRNVGADYGGESDVTIGQGAFSVVVTPGETPGAFAIESTGHFAEAASRYDAVTLRATVTLAPDGRLHHYALHPLRVKETP